MRQLDPVGDQRRYPIRPAQTLGVVPQLQGIVPVADAMVPGEAPDDPVCLVQRQCSRAMRVLPAQMHELGEARARAASRAIGRGHPVDQGHFRNRAPVVVHERGSAELAVRRREQKGRGGRIETDGNRLPVGQRGAELRQDAEHSLPPQLGILRVLAGSRAQRFRKRGACRSQLAAAFVDRQGATPGCAEIDADPSVPGCRSSARGHRASESLPEIRADQGSWTGSAGRQPAARCSATTVV